METSASPGCPGMQRWESAGLVGPEWAAARPCAPTSLRAATGQTHFLRLSAAASDPAEGRPVTSSSSRGVPKASEAPWRGRRAPTPLGSRSGRAAGARDRRSAPPPSLPRWARPAGSPHPARAAQVPSRSSSPSPSPGSRLRRPD